MVAWRSSHLNPAHLELTVKFANASMTPLASLCGTSATVCSFVLANCGSSSVFYRRHSTLHTAASLSLSNAGKQWSGAYQTEPGEGNA